MAKLSTVSPPNAGGVYVDTTSIPWVRVEKSLMKNRNSVSDSAEVMPSASRSARDPPDPC